MDTSNRLRLLGGLDLVGTAGAPGVLAQRKRFALLVYLALAPGADFTPRDSLLGMFWPELDEEHARNALSQALRFLRRQLGDAVILRRGESEIALNRALVRCDTDDFESAYTRGDWPTAIELYGGQLLAGFHLAEAVGFEHWLDGHRNRLSRCFAESLERTAKQYSGAGRHADAVKCWERRAALDPHDTTVAMRLMQALADSGRRTTAIAHATAHARALATDIQAEPDAAIWALADRLRVSPAQANGQLDQEPPSAAKSSEVDASHDPAFTPRIDTHARERRAPRFGMRSMLVGASVMVVLFGAWRVERGTSATETPATRRVVVSAFENATGDESIDQLGKVAADWITDGLQRTGIIEVVPPIAPTRGQHGTGALRQLARAASADYVVHGRISIAENDLRFQPQIVDAASWKLVGAPAAVLIRRGDPMRGIEDLRQRVMGSLASVLDPRVGSWAATATNPPSVEAFKEFQAGLDAFWVARDRVRSVRHFINAASVDSTYFAPRIWGLYAMSRYNYPARQLDSAIQASERARARLAPTEALMLDRVEAMRRDDRVGALRASFKLVSLAPTSYFAKMFAEDASSAAQSREGIAILAKLDTRLPWVRDWSDYWATLSYALHEIGDYQRELEVARRARATRPDGLRFMWLESQALVGLGRLEDLPGLTASADSAARAGAHTVDGRGDIGLEGLYRNLGLELRAHGHPELGRAMLLRADRWYADHLDNRDQTFATRHHHMLLLDDLGRWSEAASLASALLDSVPDNPMVRTVFARASAMSGARTIARSHLDTLTSGSRPERLYEAAKIASTLGESDRAIELLRVAFANGQRHTFWDHLAIPFEPLRERPSYQELFRQRP